MKHCPRAVSSLDLALCSPLRYQVSQHPGAEREGEREREGEGCGLFKDNWFQ